MGESYREDREWRLEEAEAAMAVRHLKKIPLGSSSVNSQINSRKRYRVRIEGQWYEGSFSKQWFGWQFDEYGSSGIQLNLIEEVFEVLKPNRNTKEQK